MADLYNGISLKKMIHQFLDNELPNEQQNSITQLIDENPRVQNMVIREKDYREYIKNTVKRPTVSPDMMQSIIEKIRY
jgi:hypothetical protein